MRPVDFVEQVERFRGDVAAVLGRRFGTDDIFAVAVSGGPDSMALLALAHAASPGQVIAATVNHGLRAAAADEAAMVAEWCTAPSVRPHPSALRTPSLSPWGREKTPKAAKGEGVHTGSRAGHAGVSHTILHPAEPLGTGNVQATARTARYALLTDWAIANGATMLATAHHTDDQAETFLMRAARGSGLAGLSGIRPKREVSARRHVPGFPKEGVVMVDDEWTIPLIRPLLGWRRDELRALVEAAGISFVDDPSNADEHYNRTRFRRLLAENAELDPVRIAETARYAREGHEALEAMIDWLWQDRKIARPDVADCDDQTWLNLAGLPREVRRRLAREAIEGVRTINGIVRPAFSLATNIEPLLDAVEGGTSATQAGILVSRSGDIWHFREAPPRRDTRQAQS